MIRITRGKCPVCGLVGYLQVLNKGRFYRIRHYDRMVDGRPKFHYHTVSKDQANAILASDSKANLHLTNRSVIPMTSVPVSNDQENPNSDPNLLMEPRAGIEPATYSLQGCCSTD